MTLLKQAGEGARLGTPASADKLVYEEKDDSFYMGVLPHQRPQVHLHRAAEHGRQRISDAPAPPTRAAGWVLAPREREFRYQADHVGNRWVIRTDWNAKNYKLMQSGRQRGRRRAAAPWNELVPVSDRTSSSRTSSR